MRRILSISAAAMLMGILAGCGAQAGGAPITTDEKRAMDSPPKQPPPEARQRMMEMSRKMREARPPAANPSPTS